MVSTDTGAGGHPREDANPADDSVPALVARATQQVAELVREELRLAQTEMAAKGRRLGLGGGLFGGSALVALLGVQALAVAAIAGLATELAVWASALIVAGILLAAAAVLALIAKRQVTRAGPLIPEQAVESVKDDLTEIKKEAHR